MIIVEIDRCRQFITIEGIIMLEALLLQQEEVPPVEDPHLHIFNRRSPPHHYRRRSLSRTPISG
jgi:hypothetical protein